jgi:hypothetical protein
MRKTIMIISALLAAAAVTAGCSAARPHHHPQPVAATSSAPDLSCQAAGNANIRAEGALGAGITTGTLSRAATFWKLASSKISNSGVPLLHTRDGRLTVDLDYAALDADRMIVDLRLGLNSDLGKQSRKLFAAEQKITADCPG